MLELACTRVCPQLALVLVDSSSPEDRRAVDRATQSPNLVPLETNFRRVDGRVWALLKRQVAPGLSLAPPVPANALTNFLDPPVVEKRRFGDWACGLCTETPHILFAYRQRLARLTAPQESDISAIRVYQARIR